jgi:phosphinothricin acetyltransferase
MSIEKDIIIRDATIKDLEAIVGIYNSTVPGRMVTADTEPVTVESREKWFYEHNSDFRPLWVVEKDEKICAWLSFQSFYGRPAYNGTVEVSIYVSEICRGKGLGRILLQKAIDACEDFKIKTILGFVFGHNVPSLKLFESFGFEAWGNFPKIAELDGVERDLIIVGKRVKA